MNYYKILEVDKDASPEIIEKAYKTLAKKYHPDLQESNMKQEAEEKLKLINEAYEILSNPDSRAKYDNTLKEEEASKKNRELYNQINNLKYNNIQNDKYLAEEEFRKKQEIQIQQARQKAYYDAYMQNYKNNAYKNMYKKRSLKNYLKNFVAFGITIAILLILWQIPFIHNFFIKLYEENTVMQTIVNLFK